MRRVDPVKHENKRREILGAAAKCFASQGFKGTSIDTICAAAKVSAGHLYHYFENKEAIIAAMVEAKTQEAASKFAALSEKTNAIEAFLAEIGQAHANRDPAADALAVEIWAEGGRNKVIAEIVRRHTKGVRELLTTFFKNGQDRGQVDPSLDPALVATILMGVADGLGCLAIKDPDVDFARLLDHVKLLFVRFLPTPQTEPGNL